MRVYHKKKWDVTHSLTPSFDELSPPRKQPLIIPEIKQNKEIASRVDKNVGIAATGRSRKHRLYDQKNTEIQKNNRRLYSKIRKIMQKGHTSEKIIQPPHEQNNRGDNNDYNELNTTFKPLSLPHISSAVESFRTTQSELSNILDHRNKYAQKYFADLLEKQQKLKNLHTEEIGNFVCFGWKVKVVLLDHGQFLVLKGRKGKKEVTKKYIYEKVKSKTEKNMEEWVSGKFEFEI